MIDHSQVRQQEFLLEFSSAGALRDLAVFLSQADPNGISVSPANSRKAGSMR